MISTASHAHLPIVNLTRRAALAAVMVVLLMVVLIVSVGPSAGQDQFQTVHTPAEYTALLNHAPSAFLTLVGLDNFFMVLYGTAFTGLYVLLRRDQRVTSGSLLSVAFTLLAAATLLDLVENMHFMVMRAAVAEGVTIGAGQMQGQVWESLLKFRHRLRRNETSRQLEALRVKVILAGKPALDEERAPGALASTQQVSAGGDRYRRRETPRRLPGGTRHSQ